MNNPAYMAAASNYTANLARWRDLHTEEGVFDTKLSYAWNADRGALGLGFKAGGEYRRLRRARDNEQFDLSNADRTALRMGDFLSDARFAAPYQPEPFFFLDTDKLRDYFRTAPLVRVDSASTSADFVYLEKVLAGYAMGVLSGDRYRVIAGGRYEHTDFSADAAGQSGVVGSRFGDFLPSINASYDLTDELKLRGAYSKSLGRPNPGDLAQTLNVQPTADDAPVDLIVSRGNPGLKPRRVDNFDLSLEYYFDDANGLLAVALFQKDIKGDIFNLRTRGEYQGQSAEFRQNINAVGSKVKGVELSASLARMPFLPGLWEGFGFSVNLPFIDGSMEIPGQGTGSDVTVTTTRLGERIRQPDLIANTALFYNYEGFEARVVYNRTASFLTSLTQREGAYSQVDASLRYTLDDHWTFSLEGRNLTSANRFQYASLDDFDFLFGKTDIDRSFHLGATYKY